MMIQLPPISEGTYLRAAEADPNKQRCLIENYPKERAIQLTHVLPRSLVKDGDIMSMLEWRWNLRRGTLNLDTRENICFLGASMKLLYQNGKWGLLPEDHIIERYHEKKSAGFLLPRDEFPVITGETFSYTLVPLNDMDNVALTRQSKHPASAGGFETHLYPYPDFPRIVSHIHPRFAIMGFAHNVEAIPSAALRSLCQAFPIVKKLLAVSSAWKRMLPPEEVLMADPTYMDPEVVNNDEDEEEEQIDGYESDGDSICTVPRRIIFLAPPAPKRRRDSEDSEDEIPPSKSRRTGETDNGPEVAGDNAWNANRISEWVREVSTSPPPRGDKAERR
ncbi:hypothetical protein BKA70DRAFT_1572342 [Coprinopsis sp. MPI-PUGE-AT-0042]|nr:hypothetical protein BKA70DRAFT_1572342 [Coprinopsis sp. MPI-PUGE-AT-0042]